MILGIDASNIQEGGGVTHLREMLNNCNPAIFGFKKVILWSGARTLGQFRNHAWLEKKNPWLLNRSLIFRIFWQQFVLPGQLLQEKCTLLFSPGGTLPFKVSVPTVTMSQNMLPFEKKERERFKSQAYRLKFILLGLVQGNSFKRASGLIFLSDYAKKYIQKKVNRTFEESKTISHGVDSRFMMRPRRPRRIEECSDLDPFRLLYVSIIDVYKHQWQVVEAVGMLRRNGLPVCIDFVGPSRPEAMGLFELALKEEEAHSGFIKYCGPVAFDALEKQYQGADVFVFASTCENLPNILLEAMAAGLPIASSDRGPMPEVLGSHAEFFDPESPESIARALTKLIVFPELRKNNAEVLFGRVQSCSWNKCAHETFEFLSHINEAYGSEYNSR